MPLRLNELLTRLLRPKAKTFDPETEERIRRTLKEMEGKKIKKVEWFKNPNSLSEIYQKTGIIFTFVAKTKDGFAACHEWAKCRDFLHDAVRSQITGKPSQIFGFRFNPAKNPNIDMKRTRMLVSRDGLRKEQVTAFRNKMVCGLALVNHFEKYAGVSLTKMEEVDATGSKKQVVFMFTGPRMWMLSPCLVSMYTYLLRLGDKELKFADARVLKKELKALAKKKDSFSGDNDVRYLVECWSKLHPIIKHRAKLFPKTKGVHDVYFSNYDINTFHNRMGIFSLSKAETADNGLNERMKELSA
jgi:hypothetical protein